uniref:Uncharacterized protein n=1 Tax=Anguilla anguilla TaxID=7936 RepID=A0A0E9VX44_ANGAN
MPWNPKLVEPDLHCVLQRSIPNALIENFFQLGLRPAGSPTPP